MDETEKFLIAAETADLSTMRTLLAIHPNIHFFARNIVR